MHMFTASGIKWKAKDTRAGRERLSAREDTFELAEKGRLCAGGRQASVGLLSPSSLFFFKPAKYE